ncbi:MAG TPA: hypothetical protein VFG33_19860 [Kribbella sp.]|uniref:hypothetical protein n=1 Tax=Kribbella sp. TaxID=1871183 RepID=UPI002D793B06|nr:hypothetical protein [Kribbella sp.]HET6295654.1 hypothetical protein [Kribbella sp.]
MRRQIRHGQSHASLLHDVSAASVPRTRSRLDAIVVPAARSSSALQDVISLSAALSVPLVVLCSRQVSIEQVAQRVEKTFGARALIIEVPEGYQLLDDPHLLTSDPVFKEASAGRSSDLSVKRNLGLFLGRLRGWKKILYFDDDIRQVRPQHIERMASILDSHPVASMASRVFPDNSVVCHARRLAGLDQDVFVSGAAMAVDLQHPDLSFFPDIYNEDWFFFARHAAARYLPKIGEVRQTEYQPFNDPWRAEREEFGDLLAEGLYALFERKPGSDFGEHLTAATRDGHWQRFAQIRMAMVDEIRDALSRAQYRDGVDNPTILQAQRSLESAADQASKLTPGMCVDFIESWREDERRWQQVLHSYTSVLSERDALAELGLTRWLSCGYGVKPASFGPESEPELGSERAVG